MQNLNSVFPSNVSKAIGIGNVAANASNLPLSSRPVTNGFK